MTDEINRIVVVGGGSAGWLSAANFISVFPDKEIILVESDNIPTIGVGESTTAMFKYFINGHLGISDDDFMPGCDAVYKMSVKFKNFSKENDKGFHYPFGLPLLDNLDPFYIESWNLVKHFYPEIEDNFCAYFFPAFHLFSNNKFDNNINGDFDNYDPKSFLGYHLDANKLGPFLRDFYCLPRGVKHIIGDVGDIGLNNGCVKFVRVDDRIVHGDLFVDCTGYKSLLLKQVYAPQFTDLSDNLINNRAWATPIQYKNVYKELQPYTTSTALKNGWAWYTPISSRVGNGYAYSDKYITSNQALVEFKDYLLSDNFPISLSKTELENLPFFELKINAGYYDTPFVKNVVGIGLSSGFLEPLEGTGLFFITEPLLILNKLISRNCINQFMRDSFNNHVAELYESWSDVLSSFYCTSARNDSLYWNEIQNKNTTQQKDSLYQKNYHGLREFQKRYISDHISNTTDFDAFTAMSIGNGLSSIDETSIRNWTYNEQVNFSQIASNYKKILEDRKNKWIESSKNSIHIVDYLRKLGSKL